MSQFQTFILAIGAFQGVVLFVLLISDGRVSYASKLLGIQCFFISTTFALPLIVEANVSMSAWLIGPLVFLPACYGALTYLYCRTAITGASLKYSDIIHFLPLAICYFLNIDIVLSAEKAYAFVRMPETVEFRHTLTKLAYYGQIVVYTVLLVRLISYYQVKARQNLSSYNPEIFKWLWSLIVFTGLFWALKTLFYFLKLSSAVNILADFLLVLLVYGIAVIQWRNPGLFHVKQLKKELKLSKQSDSNTPTEGVLDQDMRSNFLSLVQEHVKNQALYRDSDLTLATLAEKVGISVHHLSETLNQEGGKNFNQFVNEYRVAEVCQQLKQKNDRNLVDLALEAGFSSRSSFNAIFKKITGKTPSLYRQQLGPSIKE